MLQNIWSSKKDKGQDRRGPFLSYSIFGDPAKRFEHLPDRHHPVWISTSGEHTDFRMLLGMAWLNQYPIHVITADDSRREQVVRWVEEARQDLLIIPEVSIAGSDKIPSGQPFADILLAWRKEWEEFERAILHLSDARFGVINALEVAHSLLRMYEGVGRLPFTWVDRSILKWTPEELQELLRWFRTSQVPPRIQALQRMAQRLDIHLPALLNWPEHALERALTDRMDRLSRLIGDYELILFRLRALLLHTPIGAHAVENMLKRSTVLGLEETLRHRSGLTPWISALQLFEQELISDGWFLDFKGFQGISLEEIDRELRSLDTRLRVLREWVAQWSEGARIQVGNTALPEQLREVAGRVSGLEDPDLEASLTFWYLYGWLEKAIPSPIWLQLEETPQRTGLARLLAVWVRHTLSAMTQLRDKGNPASVPFQATVAPAPPSQIPGILLYWNFEPSETFEDMFHFAARRQPAIPLDYLRLQQDWKTVDPSRRFALPHPIPAMRDFWDGAGASWPEFGAFGFSAISQGA